MKRVLREEIVDYVTYQQERPAYRERVMALKATRRIHLGAHLTFLFENHETIRYQIQEMVLAERIVREADIAHELETYNELLGAGGALGATLLIEIESAEERADKLTRWVDLPGAIYARLEDGTLVRPVFDERQIDAGKLSSVHYVKFDTHGQVPIALACDHPDLKSTVLLTAEQRQALADDLVA